MNLAIGSFIYSFNALSQVLNGILIKYAGTRYGINLYFLILIKSVFGLFFLYPFAKIYFYKIKNNLFKISILAILASIDILLWNIGLSTVPANEGTLIMLLIPVWILILSRLLLKESSLKVIDYFGIFISFFGVVLVMSNGDLKNLHIADFKFGHFIIFINTFIVAVGLILQKKMSDSRPIPFALFTNNIATFIIVSLMMKDNHLNFEITDSLVFISVLVFLLDLLEMYSVYRAYQITSVSLLQPIRFTRIIFSIVFSYFLLNEKPTYLQIIASSMIIIGNLLIILYNRRR